MTALAALRASLRTLTLAALFAAPIVSEAACSTAEGTTPDCANDVTADGIEPDLNKGCSGFAVCRDQGGNEADPKTVCCKDKKTECGLQTCLFGYGATTQADFDAACKKGSSGSGGSGGAG